MRRTISRQLIFSFLLFSIVIIGLFGWFSVRLLDSHFSEYVSERRTQEITGFADEIEAVYAQVGGWDEESVAVIGRQALQADIILKVYDSQGNTDLDPHCDGGTGKPPNDVQPYVADERDDGRDRERIYGDHC